MGAAGCQCLGDLPSEITVIDCIYDWAVDGQCLEKDNLPGNYGAQCGVHAEPGDEDCYVQGDPPTPRADPEFWCGQKWCYVDPCNCDMADATKSTYFDVTMVNATMAYSYATCGGANGYTDKKFPNQNMVGNANSERYDGDCGLGDDTYGSVAPTEPPLVIVEYDLQFTADIDETAEELEADTAFIAALKESLAKGWIAAGSAVEAIFIVIVSITLTDPSRRLLGELEPLLPRRMLNESGLANTAYHPVHHTESYHTPNLDPLAELKKIAASSEYKARARAMERTLARRTKASERGGRRLGGRRLASKSVKVDYKMTVPQEEAVALNTKVQDTGFTESFSGAFSEQLEVRTEGQVAPSAVTPSTTPSEIDTSATEEDIEALITGNSTKSTKAVADGAALLTMSLGTFCLVAAAF